MQGFEPRPQCGNEGLKVQSFRDFEVLGRILNLLTPEASSPQQHLTLRVAGKFHKRPRPLKTLLHLQAFFDGTLNVKVLASRFSLPRAVWLVSEAVGLGVAARPAFVVSSIGPWVAATALLSHLKTGHSSVPRMRILWRGELSTSSVFGGGAETWGAIKYNIVSYTIM